MMEREFDRRRGWPWKNRKNIGLSSGSDGGSSPVPVKLFDEQEVGRVLQDQVRIGDEQMVEALTAADAKHAEKEKAWNAKLTAALSELTIKDNLVKQHIKVAEDFQFLHMVCEMVEELSQMGKNQPKTELLLLEVFVFKKLQTWTEQLATLITASSGVVTTTTGALQLPIALKKPTVALFSSQENTKLFIPDYAKEIRKRE